MEGQEFLNLRFSIQLKFSHLPLLEKIVYFFIARMEAGVGIVFETEPYISISHGLSNQAIF